VRLIIVPAKNAPFAHELRAALGQLIRRLRSVDSVGGPTWSQLAILGRLEREGDTTSAALAAAERIRPQSMGAALDVMEAENLIVRRPDTNDRRQVRISVSARGREIVRRSRAACDEWLTHAISTRLTRAEQATLREAIALMARLAEGDSIADRSEERTGRRTSSAESSGGSSGGRQVARSR
jgi:DNA-binding MarR family transcriptional regulator